MKETVKINLGAKVLPLMMALVSLAGCQREQYKAQIAQFEQNLHQLREKYQIPGLSAAILKDQKVIYQGGIGYADIEAKIPANVFTTYRIASLTKPFTSVIVLQLADQNKLDPEKPVQNLLSTNTYQQAAYYGAASSAQLKHYLSHSSQGIPGEQFQYNGAVYGRLCEIIERASGQPFAQLLRTNIIRRLGMNHTLPYQEDNSNPLALAKLARPYQSNGQPGVYPSPMKASCSAGMISNVVDLAKFDRALDRDQLLKPETKAKAFTAMRTQQGQDLPYGLGWFVQHYQGRKLVWHYGYQPQSFSSLILKVPEQSLTLILLANSDGLSAPFPLGNGDVSQSTFAKMFLDIFMPGAS
ncbi:MAG: beta-lactamase family protein [Bacteroidia bacterium]|nr:beta-lactamase family protein [Bacteroidia bacterium]